MKSAFLDPTPESGRDFYLNAPAGPLVMLNLLRFRETADYSASPELKPDAPISGREAYRLYMRHTVPFLKAAGGELTFTGTASAFLIGPPEERWDGVLLVRQRSKEDFMAFAQNEDYQKIIGHRTAALLDSRLLPMGETTI